MNLIKYLKKISFGLILSIILFSSLVNLYKEKNNIINKITNHISNEIQETKEFQKKNWAKGNAQLKRNFNTIKFGLLKNSLINNTIQNIQIQQYTINIQGKYI